MLKGPGYIEMRKREKNGTRRRNEIVIINPHIPYLRGYAIIFKNNIAHA